MQQQQPQTRILFLIGPPSSGKSTQASLIVEKYPERFLRFSPGDVLRSLAGEHTSSDLGAYIKHNWNHDSLVPIVNELIEQYIDNAQSSSRDLVVDGFPRTVEEATHIPRICTDTNVLCLEILLATTETRMRSEERQRCKDDTNEALDIRLESYYRHIDQVRAVLYNDLNIYCAIEGTEDREELHKTIDDNILRSDQNVWTYIPAAAPKDTDTHTHTDTDTDTDTRITLCLSAITTATIIQKSLRLAESTRHWKQFCGTHPISLDRENVANVVHYPFLVSRKADGVRHFCIISDACLYFMDRKLTVYKGPCHPFLEQFNDSLFDGELINDASLFLVIDVLCVAGKNVMHDPIIQRLRASVEIGRFLHNSPVRFIVQRYWELKDLYQCIKEPLPEYSTDGLVFTPKSLPYRLGIDRNMTKWKPPDKNTLDLQYDATTNTLHCRNIKDKCLLNMGVCVRPPPWLKHGMVCECQMVSDDEWYPVKARLDKSYPNVDWVANRVVTSIKDHITMDDLLHLLRKPTNRTKMIRTPRSSSSSSSPPPPTPQGRTKDDSDDENTVYSPLWTPT